MAVKRLCACGKKADIYHTTGDFCQKCFSDSALKAKAKIYAHLCELGLKRKEGESKAQWTDRVKAEYQVRIKRLARQNPVIKQPRIYAFNPILVKSREK